MSRLADIALAFQDRVNLSIADPFSHTLVIIKFSGLMIRCPDYVYFSPTNFNGRPLWFFIVSLILDYPHKFGGFDKRRSLGLLSHYGGTLMAKHYGNMIMYYTQNQHQTDKQGGHDTARQTLAAARLANTPLMQRRKNEQAGLIPPRQSNQTGLPDNLKSGMENLSGMSLDHVRVHRNSAKPAAVQAHAYAQGNEIHLAGGQEHHLPHELGHVVQQLQGRVKPTINVGGAAVNDDAGLESEATAMGAMALQRTAVCPIHDSRPDHGVLEKEFKAAGCGFIQRRMTGTVDGESISNIDQENELLALLGKERLRSNGKLDSFTKEFLDNSNQYPIWPYTSAGTLIADVKSERADGRIALGTNTVTYAYGETGNWVDFVMEVVESTRSFYSIFLNFIKIIDNKDMPIHDKSIQTGLLFSSAAEHLTALLLAYHGTDFTKVPPGAEI